LWIKIGVLLFLKRETKNFFSFESLGVTHKDFEKVVQGSKTKGYSKVLEALLNVKNDALNFRKHIFGNILRKKK